MPRSPLDVLMKDNDGKVTANIIHKLHKEHWMGISQTDSLTSIFLPCMGCLMPGCCGGMPCCGGIMLPTAATGGAAAWA